jgi:PTH2 family peptidyl-tRNA hydrolase
MSPGKIASQAGHAYLGAAVQADPGLLAEYHQDFPASPGTKVCLQAKNLEQIMRAVEAAKQAGIPHFLVVDSGCENFFSGTPTVTALGLGPATKAEVNHITKKFQLL